MEHLSGPLSLRPAIPTDDTFLLALYGSTRAEELAAIDWPEQQKQLFLRSQFETQRRCYPTADNQIILLQERPVGRIMVNRAAEAILLVDISLLPETRNAGIGTRLIRDLLSEAAAAAKPVKLHVLAASAARRLYERLGFREIEEEAGGIGGAKAYIEMVWVPANSS